MDQLTEKNLQLFNTMQHMKGHGTIRPRLTRQETISSLVYRPPDELINAIKKPWDWDTNPITVEIIPLDNKNDD